MVLVLPFILKPLKHRLQITIGSAASDSCAGDAGVPRNIRATFVSEATIQFTWEKPQCDESYGPIDGYEYTVLTLIINTAAVALQAEEFFTRLKLSNDLEKSAQTQGSVVSTFANIEHHRAKLPMVLSPRCFRSKSKTFMHDRIISTIIETELISTIELNDGLRSTEILPCHSRNAAINCHANASLLHVVLEKFCSHDFLMTHFN